MSYCTMLFLCPPSSPTASLEVGYSIAFALRTENFCMSSGVLQPLQTCQLRQTCVGSMDTLSKKKRFRMMMQSCPCSSQPLSMGLDISILKRAALRRLKGDQDVEIPIKKPQVRLSVHPMHLTGHRTGIFHLVVASGQGAYIQQIRRQLHVTRWTSVLRSR